MPRESLSNKRIRMESIVNRLKSLYPNSKCSLNYDSAFQLLVATILSAQCTDERVNKVTSVMFKKYPDAKAFSKLSVKEIAKEIYSTGFYNNKSKNIKAMSDIVMEKYYGEVPGNMDELVVLPGVGRKTANVVLGNYFNIPGMVVDTHVTRITNLLGFVKSRNAVVIEREMEKVVDRSDWTIFSHLLIDHGRAICVANRPDCTSCDLSDLCASSIA
ncbi:MAG: endonuclease III [bacterium TMED198]|nr:MAG: endonuclease III [bacterium TMED198]